MEWQLHAVSLALVHAHKRHAFHKNFHIEISWNFKFLIQFAWNGNYFGSQSFVTFSKLRDFLNWQMNRKPKCVRRRLEGTTKTLHLNRRPKKGVVIQTKLSRRIYAFLMLCILHAIIYIYNLTVHSNLFIHFMAWVWWCALQCVISHFISWSKYLHL